MPIKGLDPTQAARLSALLDDALARPPDARAAWLAELDDRDPLAGAHLRGLLASLSAAQAEGLLEGRGFADAGFAAALGTDDTLAGRQIGPYRVLQPIGQGGMGTVWLAERADGLFERKVALKLVHLALVGSVLAERFARERSILAGLDHPHIARLLDAGVTPDGQPYLALEYVEGTPLTAYCDEHQLDLDARLRLFGQVLDAVQYAHSNLVIHRDLKPSNILVTETGDVRLLDFGIAKLLTVDGEARETELTQLSGRAYTPEYASPEQVTGARDHDRQRRVCARRPVLRARVRPASVYAQARVARRARGGDRRVGSGASERHGLVGDHRNPPRDDAQAPAPEARGRPRHDRAQGAPEAPRRSLRISARDAARPRALSPGRAGACPPRQRHVSARQVRGPATSSRSARRPRRRWRSPSASRARCGRPASRASRRASRGARRLVRPRCRTSCSTCSARTPSRSRTRPRHAKRRRGSSWTWAAAASTRRSRRRPRRASPCSARWPTCTTSSGCFRTQRGNANARSPRQPKRTGRGTRVWPMR